MRCRVCTILVCLKELYLTKNIMRILIAVVLLTGCSTVLAQNSNQRKKEFKNLEWLVGTWNRTNTKPGRSGYEQWEKIKEEFRGRGVTLNGTDTAFVEKIKIIMRNDTIYYVADVPENDKPVYFKMTAISPDGFVCENPSHDFPKKISYHYRKDQTLKAQISGDGKVIDYFFERGK